MVSFKFNIFREIIDYYLFFKLSKKDKEIVFYAEHQGYYPNYEGIVNELVNINNLPICYVSSDISDPIFDNKNDNIKTFYFNNLLSLFFYFVDSKIFFLTMPDLNQYHLKRSYHDVHYVYIFHSMVSTHMMYKEGAFDHYDSILCTGEYQLNEIRQRERQSGLKKKLLIKSGYYRLERIYNKYQNFNNLRNNKKTILVAPSWGDKNILESCGLLLIEHLLGWDYKVIVRPHPETLKRNPKLIKSLSEKFGFNKDFKMERTIVNDDSLMISDLLICDCSGIALEYAFGTYRPVLFLDVPIKIKNKNYLNLNIEPLELYLREKIGIIVSANNMENLKLAISNLMDSKHKYKKIIKNLRKENIHSFGESSKIGIKHISNILNQMNKKQST